MRFPTEDVLSVTTGFLLCDIGGVYKVLNHLTGDDLFTHQLPRACEAAVPTLRERHPELFTEQVAGLVGRVVAAATAESDRDASFAACRESAALLLHPVLGETIDLEPLPTGVCPHVDPLLEARQMGAKDVIAVVCD